MYESVFFSLCFSSLATFYVCLKSLVWRGWCSLSIDESLWLERVGMKRVDFCSFSNLIDCVFNFFHHFFFIHILKYVYFCVFFLFHTYYFILCVSVAVVAVLVAVVSVRVVVIVSRTYERTGRRAIVKKTTLFQCYFSFCVSPDCCCWSFSCARWACILSLKFFLRWIASLFQANNFFLFSRFFLSSVCVL